MVRKWILAVVVLALLAGTVCAWTLVPWRGWVSAVHMDKALEAAKKKSCPIVFLYAEKEAHLVEEKRRMSLARVWMKLTGLQGMVKVLVYTSRRPPATFEQVAGQVQEPDLTTPRMYFATPELKILGFVLYGAHKKTGNSVALHARKTMIWINESRAEMTKAKEAAEEGRFGTALKTYQRIQAEDKKKAVRTHITWNVVLTENDFDSFYFPEIAGKIEELNEMAEARLQKAKTAYDNKDYKEARKLLAVMVNNKGDLEAVKEATELLEKVEEKVKEK
ncbi:MAG: hypothetical protein AMK75_00045 [Planctomycetes bacterium SM23_65]|nr:MAG: hypothetical protein AMK75_00045 [Planctomycetes bacterium SM23_65]